MPASLSKSLPLPPTMKMDEESKPTCEKQGIVTILGSMYDTPKTASLRRTLSADMSSKKWMEQNGIYPIKKTASSQELLNSIEDSSSSSEEDYENDKERKHIWNSIQQAKRMETRYENAGRFDAWGSILTSQKDEAAKSLPPPYVHPLVKRSSSSLSEKSLEVCTESLGSETGSDGFSSYSASEAGDMDEDIKFEEAEQQQERLSYVFDREESQVAKYNYLASKKVQPRAFPPPLPSLVNRQNGVSLSVRSRRNNGRLVLEAVTVSSPNNFQAQRLDGRLVLTFVNRIGSDEDLGSGGTAVEEGEEEEEEEIMGCYEEDVMDFDGENEEVKDEQEEGKKEVAVEKVDAKSGIDKVEFSMEQPPKMSSGVMNVHKLALLFDKPIGLPNKSPTWANNLDEDVEEGEKISLSSQVVARIIPAPPSPPPVAAKPPMASSFNTYEYFWRAKPIETPIMKRPIAQPPHKSYSNKFMIPKMSLANEPHESLATTRGKKAAYLAPLLKSCNEPRRSLFIWEPNCIVTST